MAIKRREAFSIRDEGGQSLVIVLLAMAMMIAIAALGIGVSQWYVARHQAQITADAAALAAANCLADSPVGPSGQQCSSGSDRTNAQQVAIDYATKNGLTITASQVTFIPASTGTVTSVTVNAQTHGLGAFSGLTPKISATAIASIKTGTSQETVDDAIFAGGGPTSTTTTGSFSGSTTSGSATISVSSSESQYIGYSISGAGIPIGATIVSAPTGGTKKNPTYSVVVSANATSSNPASTTYNVSQTTTSCGNAAVLSANGSSITGNVITNSGIDVSGKTTFGGAVEYGVSPCTITSESNGTYEPGQPTQATGTLPYPVQYVAPCLYDDQLSSSCATGAPNCTWTADQQTAPTGITGNDTSGWTISGSVGSGIWCAPKGSITDGSGGCSTYYAQNVTLNGAATYNPVDLPASCSGPPAVSGVDSNLLAYCSGTSASACLLNGQKATIYNGGVYAPNGGVDATGNGSFQVFLEGNNVTWEGNKGSGFSAATETITVTTGSPTDSLTG